MDSLHGNHHPRSVAEFLAVARAQLDRISPERAAIELQAGATVVDIRSAGQIAEQGRIEGAVEIPRNVAEWRLDPASEHAIPHLAHSDRTIIVCAEGYQSSLLAATVRGFGVDATDVIGGVDKWRSSGLPLEPVPSHRQRSDRARRRRNRTFQAMGSIALLALKARWATRPLPPHDASSIYWRLRDRRR